MIRKSIPPILAALVTLLILWLIGWGWFAAYVATIQPEDIETKTDAIIVLTGGKKRIDMGMELLRDKKADALFISGVHNDVTINDLVSDGPVPCCVTLGYKATDTEENGTESAGWIRKNNIKSVRLVTSNYHMARAGLIFNHHAPKTKIYIHPVEPDDFQPWQSKFWPTTFGEYNKTLATWIKLSFEKKV